MRIDAKMKQLKAQKLLEVEILSAMTEYMQDFQHLITTVPGSELDALYGEFPGFYRYAKLLESLAYGIDTGKIKVPGGRTVNKEHKIATAIDLRVRQLKEKGVSDATLLDQMIGYILDFQWLLSTVSDEKLSLLCREYPGLYHYGTLMADVAVAENKKAKTSYGHLPELPDTIKSVVAQLLADGALIESGLQTIINEQKQRDMWREIEVMDGNHEYWIAQFAKLADLLRVDPVPKESQTMMMRIFEPMAQRINHLYAQIIRN